MRAVKPTRQQKIMLKEHRLNWKNWLVECEDNISVSFINKESGKKRVILK